MVLIIGAGPVGLTLGIELARYGVPLRIVDKAAARSTTSKALVIWSRTLELLARAGCQTALSGAGHPVTAARLTARHATLGKIDFTGVDSPYRYALMLPQSETERILEEHLSALGVRVERATQLTHLAPDTPGFIATLDRAGGNPEIVLADWVVGCDGAHSYVRHYVGKTFGGDTLPSDFVLADVHLRGLELPPDELELMWHEDGLLALFPIAGDRYRVIADAGIARGAGPPAEPTLADVQRIVDRRGPGGVTLSHPRWLAAFRINERIVDDYRAGRAFLAGDAAHVHSPAGGQGMNTGIHDAVDLAWKLALVVHGRCAAEPLLSSYNADRRPVGLQVIERTGRFTTLATARNPVAQFIRDHAAQALFGIPQVRAKLAGALSETSVDYPHGPLSVHASAHRAPPAGGRAPLRAGEPLVGSGTAPRFAVAAAGDGGRVLSADFADLLEAVPRRPYDDGGLWVVRPDGYVGLAAGADAWDDARAYLERLRHGTTAAIGGARLRG